MFQRAFCCRGAAIWVRSPALQGKLAARRSPRQECRPGPLRDQAPWAFADSSTKLKRRSASNQSTSGDPTGTHALPTKRTRALPPAGVHPPSTPSSPFKFLSILTSSMFKFARGGSKATLFENKSPDQIFFIGTPICDRALHANGQPIASGAVSRREKRPSPLCPSFRNTGAFRACFPSRI